MDEKRFIGIVDFKEWCNGSNDVVGRDTITITVYAKDLDSAIQKIYDELLEIVKDDLKDIDTKKWEIGDIEDLEFGYSVSVYEKIEDEKEDEYCFYNECYHKHTLIYELVEVRDENDNAVWSP